MKTANIGVVYTKCKMWTKVAAALYGLQGAFGATQGSSRTRNIERRNIWDEIYGQTCPNNYMNVTTTSHFTINIATSTFKTKRVPVVRSHACWSGPIHCSCWNDVIVLDNENKNYTYVVRTRFLDVSTSRLVFDLDFSGLARCMVWIQYRISCFVDLFIRLWGHNFLSCPAVSCRRKDVLRFLSEKLTY